MRVSGSFCARCGARLGPGAYFCPRCGTGIPVAPANAPTVATAPPPPHDAGREALLDALRQAALGEYEILAELGRDRKSTRLNSSHRTISYAVFCLKKKKKNKRTTNSKHCN